MYDFQLLEILFQSGAEQDNVVSKVIIYLQFE